MKYIIKNRHDDSIIFEVEEENWAAALAAARAAGKSLSFADLRSANLSLADLSSANLSFADLSSANLSFADLSSANLSSANLSFADLSFADLRSANLSLADLSSANLRSADLSSAKNLILPTGETWEQYLTQTVPALLISGGKKLEEVATAKHWKCHTWSNCPMAAAFGAKTLNDVPILHRPRAEQFIMFFDAKQIPLDVVLGKKKLEQEAAK